MAELKHIWIKRGKRAPMDPVIEATLEVGTGIVGNANIGGKRQVTVTERSRWDEACESLGARVDPTLRRANLMIDGVDLEQSRGQLLRIGECRIRIQGETTPCRLMDEQHAGLQEALRPRWGGGAYGTVERGGNIRLGDPVGWVEESGS